MKRLAVLALLALPMPAQALDLTPLVCIPHGDLAAEMKARGARVFSAPYDTGRKVEFYQLPDDSWVSVIVAQVNGRVTKASCSKIFGIGDPGVSVPPPG